MMAFLCKSTVLGSTCCILSLVAVVVTLYPPPAESQTTNEIVSRLMRGLDIGEFSSVSFTL